MPVSISAFLFIHYLASTMHTVDERRKRVESARPIWNKLENKIYSEHNKNEKSQLNSAEKSQKRSRYDVSKNILYKLLYKTAFHNALLVETLCCP